MTQLLAYVVQWWNKAPKETKDSKDTRDEVQGTKQSFQIPPQFPNARRGKEL